MTGEEDRLARWLADQAGGTIRSVRPIPGGGQRRTSFVTVDASGGSRELVLQEVVDGGAYTGRGITSLLRQAAVFRALAATDVADLTPRLVGCAPDDRAILTEFVPGTSDYATVDPGERARVDRSFVEALARLHQVDHTVLDLGDVRRPGPGAEPALSWLDVWGTLFEQVRRPAPIVRFAIEWLRSNAPVTSGHTVICHGDVGPGNFMIDDGRVTTLVDWELVHLGDYHDDLGMLALRGYQLEGMADLGDALRYYEKLTGFTVDPWRVKYFRAVALVLGIVTSLATLESAGESGERVVSLPLYLHLVPMLQLLLTEALVDLSGCPVEEPAMPTEEVDLEALDVVTSFRHEVAELAKRAPSGGHTGFGDLFLHMEARARLGSAVEAAEIDDLESVLGVRPRNVGEGRAAVDRALTAGALDLDDLLSWSYRSARRHSLLWPAWAARFERRLLPIR